MYWCLFFGVTKYLKLNNFKRSLAHNFGVKMPKIEQFISLPSGRNFPSLYYGIVEKTKRNPACAEGAKYVG